MPTIDEQVMAERYGFAWNVLNSNPELKGIFNQAVAETWTPDKFVASVRNTGWYKSTAETNRNAQLLKESDPSTYYNQLDQVQARVRLMAAEYGAQMHAPTLYELSEQALHGGWDDNQLRSHLAGFVNMTAAGQSFGQSGQWLTELRDYAYQMGVKVGDPQLSSWVKQAVKGEIVIEDAMTLLREQAMSKYAAFRDRLSAGETMESIAEPYRQSMAATWEISPSERDIFDPMIQRALTATDPQQGGKQVPQALWQFEIDLRKNKMYTHTQQAQDSLMETGRQVLRDFGLQA